MELGLCSGAMLLSLSWGGGTEANDKGIVVTPAPKMRTLQPSCDSHRHRVLTLGVGVAKILLLYILFNIGVYIGALDPKPPLGLPRCISTPPGAQEQPSASGLQLPFMDQAWRGP